MDRLSICIPTFERHRFLGWTLERVQLDFLEAEIIVSDNCSPSDDDRPLYACWPGIAFIRQASNIGPFPNMLAALSAAKRQYAVYCADDDYLLPDQIATGIAYLDAHPEVAAYCAPCQIWDEVNQKLYMNAFEVKRPVTFDKSQGLDLFNFLIGNHVWPEHLIFRTPVPLKPRTRAYWAFADLPDILASGAIHFAREPFYRNVLVHPVGEREQLGNSQCLTFFDEYRAGLEVLAYGLFGQGLPYSARHQLAEMIQSFICTRMDVARRLYAQAGDMINAEMLAKRIAIADPRRDAAEAA